jgi:hypothetical protein
MFNESTCENVNILALRTFTEILNCQNLGVCILLRVLDQVQEFPSKGTLFQ